VKIALISEWVDPWRGGAETSTMQFLHCLLDRNIEVHLFTRSQPAAVPGLTVRHISGASMSRTRRSMTFAHRVERMIKNESFDVRHAITPCRYVDLYQPRGGTVAETVERNLALIRSGALRGIKRLANRFNVKQQHALKLEQVLMRDPHGAVIVALSDYVVRQLKRHYHLPDDRIRKVFNGIEVVVRTDEDRARVRESVRSEFGLGDQDVLVLAVAHNFKLKGVARWMDALALLLRRGIANVRSLLVGKGDDPKWHRRAAVLGLTNHLRFVGSSDRVRDFYVAADVLVHPTYYDPCSRVILEGMVSGLCCIASPWDGSSEVIRDGVNGFVLSDPENVDELADRVITLLDPHMRHTMAEQACGVAENVSMTRHADDLLGLYRELTAGTRDLCAVE